MSISMLIRWILLLALIAFLVSKQLARRRAKGEPTKRLSKAEKAKRSKRKRRREWEKQRRLAKHRKAKENEEASWHQLVNETLPSGIARSATQVGEIRFGFMEGGRGAGRPTFLLLHGLEGDKEVWSELSRILLAEGCHIIALDLPGFGESTASKQLSYDITSQAKRVRSFIVSRRLRDFHLVGHSVGASIAGALSCIPQSGVRSLTLIEPLGVRIPEPTPLGELLRNGENPFLFNETADYRSLLDFLCAESPAIPKAILANRSVKLSEDPDLRRQIWQDSCTGEGAFVLDLLLAEVPSLTLGLFGDRSPVVNPRTSEVLKERMRHAQAAVLENCGHLPMLEKPDETASYLLRFQRALRAETG